MLTMLMSILKTAKNSLIVSINLTIDLFDFNLNPSLELRYYSRLCSARSLNVYWIIVV